jgi:hypothetical protein
MVLPLAPLFAGGLLGGAGVAAGGLLGGKKEEITHAPYEYYAPTISSVYSPSYNPQIQYSPSTVQSYQGATYIISSPYAESKKEQTIEAESRPSQYGTWEFPIGISQEPSHEISSGTNLVTLAVIAVIGLVAFGAVTSLGGKKKK